MSPLTVLYEDNHCLAVLKPAGLLTMGFPGAPATLIDMARAEVKQRYHKSGNVFLGVVQRLDKPVSGVVLFARTSKAAARLAEQFRQRRVEKTYWAVVEGTGTPAQDTFDDWLLKDQQAGRVVVVAPHALGSRHAVVEVCRLQELTVPFWGKEPRGAGRQAAHPGRAKNQEGPSKSDRSKVRPCRCTLLELHPLTGRTHQLRVQLATRGMPIYGDRKYGSTADFNGAIALHARRLVFDHPTRHEPITVEAPLPESWHELFGVKR